MYALIAAVLFCVFLHVTVMALAGVGMGICLREISYGFAPVIARWKRVRVKLVPLSGFVRFKDSRAEDLEAWERQDAFDARPAYAQSAVILSGVFSLLIVGSVLMSSNPLHILASSFEQIVAGALSPLTHAQSLLASGGHAVQELSFASLLALVAIKFAALNLLPLPGLNGGALVALAANRSGLSRIWQPVYTTALQTVTLALLLSWLCAGIVYLI